MRIKKAKEEMSGKKWFEWTVSRVLPVNDDFLNIFKKGISTTPEETLNKDFFKLPNQSVQDCESFNKEQEAMDYALKESKENESCLYIIKSRYADMTFLKRSYYAYHFVGWAYKGNSEICEKEKFKKMRERQILINKCIDQVSEWWISEFNELYKNIKNEKNLEEKLKELRSERKKRIMERIRKIDSRIIIDPRII